MFTRHDRETLETFFEHKFQPISDGDFFEMSFTNHDLHYTVLLHEATLRITADPRAHNVVLPAIEVEVKCDRIEQFSTVGDNPFPVLVFWFEGARFLTISRCNGAFSIAPHWEPRK